MIEYEGIIRYYNTWVLAWLPAELGDYYRSLLPKAWGVHPPMNPPHVSIVRSFEEADRRRWGEYEGQSLTVQVMDGVETDGTYFWLDCFSDEVGHIRRTLGLRTFRDDYRYNIYNTYHITVGNVKNV
jgi:hypothetical protein